MNKQKIFSLLSVLGILFAIFAVIYLVQTSQKSAPVVNAVEVPERFARQFSHLKVKNRALPMPEVGFRGLNGKEISWDAFEGNYLLVNFWATWCAPCVVELPSLDKLRQRFDGKGLSVIAVSLDQTRDQDDIRKFLENRGIGDFAAYWDEFSQIQGRIRLRGIPTSFVLNPKGQILYVFEGDATWNAPDAITFFETLLNSEN